MSTATLEKPSMNGTGTTVKVETITPAKARKLLLEANTHNRKLVEKFPLVDGLDPKTLTKIED
jgi:hypothetical protein